MNTREQTRVRVHGRKVTKPKNPQERIDAIREIVTSKTFAKVDGCMIDLFSASAIVKVYDAINDSNKAKFASAPAPAMADIAFKLLNK